MDNRGQRWLAASTSKLQNEAQERTAISISRNHSRSCTLEADHTDAQTFVDRASEEKMQDLAAQSRARTISQGAQLSASRSIAGADPSSARLKTPAPLSSKRQATPARPRKSPQRSRGMKTQPSSSQQSPRCAAVPSPHCQISGAFRAC